MDVAHHMTGRLVTLFRDERLARIVILTCLGLFVSLAAIAISNESVLLEVDTAVQETTIEARTDWLNIAMVMLTELGTRYVIGVLAAGMAIWAWLTGRCRTTVAIIAVAVLVNPAFEILFKELVGRVRPDLDQILPGNGPSFPSGHVLASVGFYGLIPVVVWEATTKRWARISAAVFSVTVITIVGASRVYLDVHWTTDVFAGYLLGTVLVVGTYHALKGHGFHRTRGCCHGPVAA